jgi:hypothetical protein
MKRMKTDFFLKLNGSYGGSGGGQYGNQSESWPFRRVFDLIKRKEKKKKAKCRFCCIAR